MKNETSGAAVVVAHPKITWAMVLCGMVGAAAAGAVSAATPTDDVPQRVVRYSPQSLNSDSGAKHVYRQLVSAAELVCPGPTTGTLMVSAAIEHCRAQSVARAVHQINNPRLAALYATNNRSG